MTRASPLGRPGRRPWRVLVAVVAAAASLSGCERRPGVPPPHDWRLVGPAGGNRPIADLDVSGNGRVDAADFGAFDALAAAALARLRALGIDPTPQGGYYEGPPAGEPPVLGFVEHGDDVSAVPPTRLRELWVEAHWLALQARLVAASHQPMHGTFGGLLRQSLPGYRDDRMTPAAVCAATGHLDTTAYSAAGLTPTAVLDVDSTVWAGNGTDVFLASVIASRLPRPEANAPLRAFLEKLPGIDARAVARNDVLANAELLFSRSTSTRIPEAQRVSAKDSFYQLASLLAGVSVDEARTAAHRAVHEGAHGLPPWKSRVLGDRDGCTMARLVRGLVDEGVEVFFLSATPDVMVEEAAELFGLGPGHALGSTLEVKDGRYTGRVRDNPYAIKGPVVRQWLPAPPIVAFGDSPTSDFPMLLEATGAGFMVSPRPQFLARDVEEAGARLVSVTFGGTVGELGLGASASAEAAPPHAGP